MVQRTLTLLDRGMHYVVDPFLLTFGLFASTLSGKVQNQLLAVSAIWVILMGLMMTDRGLKLTESGYHLASVMELLRGQFLR